MGFKAAVVPSVSVQQIQDGVTDLRVEIVFGQNYAIRHLPLQGLAEELHVLNALVAFHLQCGRWVSWRSGAACLRLKGRNSKGQCSEQAERYRQTRVVRHRRKTHRRSER